MHLGYSGERKQTVQSSEEVNGSLVGAIVLTEVTKERHRKSCESKTKDLAINKDTSLVLWQTVSSREKVIPSCLCIDLQLFTMLGKKLHRLQDIGGVEPSDMLCPLRQKKVT